MEHKEITINERLVVSQLIKDKLNQIVKTKDELVCLNNHGDINLLKFFKDKQRIGSMGKYGDIYIYKSMKMKILYLLETQL